MSTTELQPNPVRKYVVFDVESEHVEHVFTENELRYWSGKPRDMVILATSSVRKAVNFVAGMAEFSFVVIDTNAQEHVFEDPRNFEMYLEKNIYNGNGVLGKTVGKNRVYLGRLAGVPVYAQSTDGESHDNDNPLREARNKTLDIAAEYQGQNVLLVGLDAVDRPNTVEEPLGKPENTADFPQRSQFAAGEVGDDAYQEAVNTYLNNYVEQYYGPAEEITHMNALAIFDCLLESFAQLEKDLLTLNITVNPELLTGARPQRDKGGAGVTQSLIQYDLEDPDYFLNFFDDYTRSVLEGRELSIVQLRYALLCQIIGTPFYAIVDSVERAHAQAIVALEEKTLKEAMLREAVEMVRSNLAALEQEVSPMSQFDEHVVYSSN